ncbi:MAG: NAD(P)/FAD-dependent oxidoreductase [Candidatus Thermoplasmatota archaeon]|jgi:digeranylgeranylglycerophospholipid reductase|nr:NAD(P)/FAD-dependent oxidoreductase [Candidatus Thermoplasmatota archaeon]
MRPKELTVQCLIVGAGPAGTVAAREAASRGVDVLVVEKRPEIGVPVRCGEGLSRATPELLGISPDKSWVDSYVKGAIIRSPGGEHAVLDSDRAGPEVGMVIRRDAFDQLLARRAVDAGARLMVRTEALNIRREAGKAVVECLTIGGRMTVSADVVVAADGFESQVARWGGLSGPLQPVDMDSCLQYEMVNVDVDVHHTEFFLGREVAPGGYAWCFPKGDDIANIGLGLNGSKLVRKGMVREHLDRFIKGNDRFRKGTVTEVNGGGVSVCLPLERTVADNLLVVGDAARMIDPLTGGGVHNSCFAALAAGRTIAEAIESGDSTEAGLAPYEARWRAGLEEEMARDLLAKEMLMGLSDATIDRLIGTLSGADLSEFSTSALLRMVEEKAPGMMRELGWG